MMSSERVLIAGICVAVLTVPGLLLFVSQSSAVGGSHPTADPAGSFSHVATAGAPETPTGVERPDPGHGSARAGSGSGRTHDVWGSVFAPPVAGPSEVELPEVQGVELPEAEREPEIAAHWLRLAECESGDWLDGGADFVAGSARWDWGHPSMTLPPWGTDLHHGGLQFAPSTWEWVAGDLELLDTFPHAYDAPPTVQVQVATEVQARQGWKAWPTCGPLVGLGG